MHCYSLSRVGSATLTEPCAAPVRPLRAWPRGSHLCAEGQLAVRRARFITRAPALACPRKPQSDTIGKARWAPPRSHCLLNRAARALRCARFVEQSTRRFEILSETTPLNTSFTVKLRGRCASRLRPARAPRPGGGEEAFTPPCSRLERLKPG